jgi:hypothetical protein
MISQRIDRIRRPPSGAAHVFVLYDRSTGAIVGVHDVLSAGAPASGSSLTAVKQRAAAKAVDEAVLRRVAATARITATRVASLRVRAPLGDFSQMRVDVARRRLVRMAGAAGRRRLSSLERPRRPRTH